MSRRNAPERFGFLRHRPDELIDGVARLLAVGQGWVNVGPDPEEVDPRAFARPSIFSARGPAAPMSTLVVGRGGSAHELGVVHGAGRRAADLLREAGVDLPAGARVLADHPRRGLVLAVPGGTAAEDLAWFLLRAASQLTTVPLGDHWVAEIYR
jgi:hypothetical protein